MSVGFGAPDQWLSTPLGYHQQEHNKRPRSQFSKYHLAKARPLMLGWNKTPRSEKHPKVSCILFWIRRWFVARNTTSGCGSTFWAVSPSWLKYAWWSDRPSQVLKSHKLSSFFSIKHGNTNMGDPVYPMIWAYLGCPTCWRPFPWGSPEGVSNLFQSPPDRDICEIFLWKTYTLPIKIQKHVTFPHDFTIFYLQKYLEIPTHIVHFAARARHGPRWPERRNTSSTPRWNWLHGITFFSSWSQCMAYHGMLYFLENEWWKLDDNNCRTTHWTRPETQLSQLNRKRQLIGLSDLPGLLKSAAQEHISAPLL